MKYSITKEDFTVTLTVNTNTGSCYSETQFIVVIKREKLDFLLKKKKKLMEVLYVIVCICCGGEEGASSEEFENAAGTRAGKQLEKRWAVLC